MAELAAAVPAEQATRYRKRLEALRSDASSWLPHWREIAEHVLPRSSRFLVTERDRSGGKMNEKINNGVATYALRKGAAALHSVLTSPAQRWLAITTANPLLMDLQAVKVWCTEVEDRMLEVFARSNLYKLLVDAYEQLLAFGTAVLFVEEDADRLVHFYCFPIGSFFVGLDGKMRPDTLYRETTLTVGQIVEKFLRVPGREEPDFSRCSLSIRTAWERGDYDTQIPVCHAVEPNREADPAKGDARNMPWRSVWFESGAATLSSQDQVRVLGVGGFRVFPALVVRWQVKDADTYGSSPAMDALGDIKSLQILEDRVLNALDQIIDPPVQVPGARPGDVLERQPGGVNPVQATGVGQRIEPLVTVPPEAINYGADQIARYERRISAAFFSELILNLVAHSEGPQKTAAEIHALQQEVLLQLGAPVGAINTELLAPLVMVVFDIMAHTIGALPPVPEEMGGAPLKVEFRSLVSQAQKAVGMGGLVQFREFALGNAEAAPESLDTVDFDKLIEHAREATGVAPDVLRDPETVAAIRQARAEQQQAAQLAEMAGPLKDAAGAAKALGETQARPGSALKNLADVAGEEVAA